MEVKSLEIKKKSYCFWDDTIKIEDFDPKLLKLDKKESPVNIDIYYIGYVTKKAIYSINSVNRLYLIIRSMDGYVEEIDNSDDRYLVISSVDSNKKVLNKFNEVWKCIKHQIFRINGSMELHSIENYDEGYDKIRFNSDVALRLNTLIKFHALTVVIRCIIKKDNKYYSEIYLDDALYDL